MDNMQQSKWQQLMDHFISNYKPQAPMQPQAQPSPYAQSMQPTANAPTSYASPIQMLRTMRNQQRPPVDPTDPTQSAPSTQNQRPTSISPMFLPNQSSEQALSDAGSPQLHPAVKWLMQHLGSLNFVRNRTAEAFDPDLIGKLEGPGQQQPSQPTMGIRG